MKSLVLFGVLLAPVVAQVPTPAPAGDAWPQATFEIFKLAPGRQEAFIRKLAQWDEVSAAGGQPATQIFVHDGGDDWDVLLFKPHPKVPVTPAQQAAMDAKAKQLRLKTGPAFFLELRQNVAAHTDSKTVGPITATQWLAKLDAWRKENPEAAQLP